MKEQPRSDELTKNGELLLELVRSYTIHKDDVEVTSEPHGRGELLRLRVNRDDYPAVCGSRRRMSAALVTLFKFIGARDKTSIRVVLYEEPDQWIPRSRGYDGADEYDPEAIKALVTKVLGRVLAEPFGVILFETDNQVTVEVEASRSEEELLNELVQYTGILFHAIGKLQGRALYIEASPAIEL